jgi:hypothetical protein
VDAAVDTQAQIAQIDSQPEEDLAGEDTDDGRGAI